MTLRKTRASNASTSRNETDRCIRKVNVNETSEAGIINGRVKPEGTKFSGFNYWNMIRMMKLYDDGERKRKVK